MGQSVEGRPMDERNDDITPDLDHADTALDEITTAIIDRLMQREQIGSGGMGTVSVVQDRALKRLQAKKTIHEQLQQSIPAQMKFIREARITAQLEHPNVVPVHDIGVDPKGSLYFTMKLVEGRNLRSIIRQLPDGPIEHEQLLNLIDVVIKVCDALGFAHSRGVVHCDVKPSNIMVGEYGQVYLLDWGVARRHGRFRLDSQMEPDASDGSARFKAIGTPIYMSPEQALGDESRIDQRSDVFLVGAVMYEILTRRPPYRDVTVIATLMKAAKGELAPPEDVVGNAATPPGLRRIVMKAMAPDPSERYQSILALQEDLIRFSRGGSQFPRLELPAGSTVIREGEQGDAAYFIISGRCRVTIGEGSQRQAVREMGPGEAFGETSLLSPGPRTATVTAIEDTTVEVVTRDVFEGELGVMRPWMARFIRTLADRFRERELGGTESTADDD